MIKKKNLSQEDKKTWEDYLKNPSDIFDKDYKQAVEKRTKYRFKFDLHGFNLDDANKKVKEIILSCIQKNYKEILLITGKGIHSKNDLDMYSSKDFGKLKFSVPDFINSDQDLNKLIISINEADPRDGGEGAVLIRLKNFTK